MTTRTLLDLTIEEVACKSGVLLADHDVRSLLAGTPMEEWSTVFDRPPDFESGVRPEFIEDLVRVLRAGVGNLPDATPGGILSMRRLKRLIDSGTDLGPIIKAFEEWTENTKSKVLGEEAVREVAKMANAPLESVIEVCLAFADQMDRSLALLGAQPSEWDGVLPLSELFDVEAVPNSAEAYLDQRYIDYLAAQGEQLSKIHWRNFERLTAEFFKRAGYEVRLGPGSKDGGVDVRVWPAGSGSVGPPLLLIQCKRYRAGELVELSYVKALWTDVHFEGAAGGLIATTARVSPEGKRVSHARKYSLSFAESESVKGWTKTMWRHSWDTTNHRSVGVGTYMLPPIVP